MKTLGLIKVRNSSEDALVDPEDVPLVNAYKWTALVKKSGTRLTLHVPTT